MFFSTFVVRSSTPFTITVVHMHALALIIAITVSFAIATGVELVSSFSLHYWI